MKLAIVGCGSRHQMFRDAITGTYAERHELVALCDNNPERLALSARAVPRQKGNGVATYSDGDFGTLLAEQKPDAVIITTPDYMHGDYIVQALEAGSDVICEKPLTIDLETLRRITDAQARTGRKVTVTFNYRYSPARTQVRDLLDQGVIGTVTAVDFRWYLDRVHGADYFRRWHRQKRNSGGLLVHKSTHHFDLLNWWLGTRPKEVFASGQRAVYRPETAAAMGLSGYGPRCTGCTAAAQCDYRLDLDSDDNIRQLYREAEHEDGYFRDLCLFDPDIGIEDTMQVHIRYASGASANYTLTAYAPWEGLEVEFHGTKGTLRHRHVETHGILGGKGSLGDVEQMSTTLHLAGEAPREIEVAHGKGAHGGADPVMLGYILAPDTMVPETRGRASDHISGGWSILTGIAANEAIDCRSVVSIADMLARHGIRLGDA